MWLDSCNLIQTYVLLPFCYCRTCFISSCMLFLVVKPVQSYQPFPLNKDWVHSFPWHALGAINCPERAKRCCWLRVPYMILHMFVIQTSYIILTNKLEIKQYFHRWHFQCLGGLGRLALFLWLHNFCENQFFASIFVKTRIPFTNFIWILSVVLHSFKIAAENWLPRKLWSHKMAPSTYFTVEIAC